MIVRLHVRARCQQSCDDCGMTVASRIVQRADVECMNADASLQKTCNDCIVDMLSRRNQRNAPHTWSW